MNNFRILKRSKQWFPFLFKIQGGVIQTESKLYTWSLGKGTVEALNTKHHQQQGECGQVVTKSKTHGSGLSTRYKADVAQEMRG